MTLLLDTDTFLTSALSFYAFDICSGYWDWLLTAAEDGHVASVDRVKRELREKDDQIRHWIDLHASKLFLRHSAAVDSSMSNVAIWATSNGYTDAAAAEFLGKADAFLVAHATAEGHEVVTLETSEPRAKSRIKIPDACTAHGVTCINPFDMLRRHGVKLKV